MYIYTTNYLNAPNTHINEFVLIYAEMFISSAVYTCVHKTLRGVYLHMYEYVCVCVV